MWFQWIPLAALVVFITIRVVANVYDRPTADRSHSTRQVLPR